MSAQQQVLEEVLDAILGSWTALELAVAHFDGQYRDAQNRRQTLLESLTDALLSNQYELVDIAEFLNEYMLEQFSMELDDNSHYEVAKVALDAHAMIRQGVRPHIRRREHGAAVSMLKDQTEEVSDNEDMECDAEPQSQSSHQPRIITDDDGWSTVVPREQRQ
jgi:hypothetical protein